MGKIGSLVRRSGFGLVSLLFITFITSSNAFAASLYTYSDDTPSGSEHNLNWGAVASDSTGKYLAAVVNGGDIYTSTNYGATWTDETPSGTGHNQNWSKITSVHLVSFYRV
jgi:hypothetical protein